MHDQTYKQSFLKRVVSSFVILTFVFSLITPPAYLQAQESPNAAPLGLPQLGTMVQVTPGYQPTLIKGIITHPDNPLEFDFIVDQGETRLQGEDFNEEARRQIKYFLAALTTPEEEMWVNLSPYEGERIIPTGLGLTEMGQDLLAQDYILKQLTASLMYPEDKLGSEFWDRVRTKAQAKYGTTEIPMNTYNKIWIVPDQATVYQKGASAFVLENKLKVMLEEDYVALTANLDNKQFGFDQVDHEKAEEISGVTSQVIKEVLIPEIEYEVNNGKHFAKLRQIANAMVLATWYKQNLKESLLGYVYVDQNKTKGIDAADKEAKDKIYDQYIKAFERGVYNYIKEDYDPRAQQVILRKYFSGGFDGIDWSKKTTIVDGDREVLSPRLQGLARQEAVDTADSAVMVNINLIDAGPAADGKAISDLNRVASRSALSMSLGKDRISLRPATSDAAMLVGTNYNAPAPFNQFLRQQIGLTPRNLEFVTIKGNGEQAGAVADNPMARYVLETASAAALGSFNLRGQGRYTKGQSRDIKKAADANAVQMIEEETVNFIFDNPGFALVELASEGKRDGSVSLPLGRIYNASLGDNGFIDTVKFKIVGDKVEIESFDVALYKKTIDSLREQGVQVFYKVNDALEKTEGLTDPAALNNPTDSWALSAVIGDVAQGKYLLPIDDDFRRAGISYNAPKAADIGPIDLPSVALPKIAEAHGLVKGTTEYDEFMNQVTIVTLGPREIDLGKDSGNERHAAIIADAINFKKDNGYEGMQVSPVSDGDLMPRLIALAGPSELTNNRRVVSFGRSGSAEAEAARAFAQQIPGARMVSRLVSTTATKNNVAYETADNYSAKEIATAELLGYTREEMSTVTADETLGTKTFIAMTAVTGATDHLGSNFQENMQRVTYNDAELIVQTNTLFSDQIGNLFVVRTTYGSEDMRKSRASINLMTKRSQEVIEDDTFQSEPEAAVDQAVLTTDVTRASAVFQITTTSFSKILATRIDRRKVLDDFAEAGGISASQTLDNLVKAGMAVKQGTDIYDYALTDDFYTDDRVSVFRDLQVASSQNPAATDLSPVRMFRIIYSGVDQNGLFSDLAPGNENQFVFRLNQARSLPLLTSAWNLSNAKKQAAAKPAQKEPFALQKFVDQSGINDFFRASGIQVEFSAPERITVSQDVSRALTEYQQAYQNDIAAGQFNYRGTGTAQTVSDYYSKNFKPQYYDLIHNYINQQFDGGRGLKTIVTNGIGANDQFMWALVEMYNRNRPEGAPVWHHVTTARDLATIEMEPASTLFIDISRSGSTWEGVQVANQTLANGFTKRIVLANGGVLKAIADSANSRDAGAAIQIGMQPDIGGRNMHRKTPIYYTAQTVVGMFVPQMDADNFARLHDEFDRMNDFANPASLAVNSAKFLNAMMELRGTDHVAYISNSRQTAILGTELGQYFMEGSNKEHVISYGEHDLSNPELEPAAVLQNLAASKAGEKTFAIAVLDKASPNFEQENARVEELKQKLPMIKFVVDSSEPSELQGLSQRQQAAFDIFTTDFITALTSLLRVDANSNPNVKVVRGLTASYVAQWQQTAQRYQTDQIGSGQTDLLLSFGRPGTKDQTSVGTPEKQTAVNSVEEAREQGRALADQLAAEKMTTGRNRLNVFVGADELAPFSKELRRDTFGSPLTTKHGFITETGIYPLRAHKGHEATLAYRSPDEIAQGKAPLLANKSINIFLNQRVLGENAFYNQPFQNVTGVGAYDNVNGANINQTNDSMTFPNIQRAAEVAPTVLFEFATMTPDIKEKIRAFNETFTDRLAEIFDAEQDAAVLSVQSGQDLDQISSIISQQLSERNVVETDKTSEVRSALTYADTNGVRRELTSDQTLPYEIDAVQFFTSLSQQLGLTPGELTQSLSGSTNESVQKLAQEAMLTYAPGATQLPVAVAPDRMLGRSADNKRVLVRVDEGIEVRDIASGNRVSLLTSVPAYDKIEFSDDARRVKVTDQNGFSLYDVATGNRLIRAQKSASIVELTGNLPVLKSNAELARIGSDATSRLQSIRETLRQRFEELALQAAENAVFTLSPEELEAVALEIEEILQAVNNNQDRYFEVVSEALMNSDDDARRLRDNGVKPQVYNVNAVKFVELLSSDLRITKSALVGILVLPSNSVVVRQLGASATRYQLSIFSQDYNLAVRNANDIPLSEVQRQMDKAAYDKLIGSGVASVSGLLLSKAELTAQFGVTEPETAQIEAAVNRLGYKLPDAEQNASIRMTGEGLSYLVDEINMTMMAMNQNDVSQYNGIMRSLSAASAGQIAPLLVIDSNYDINTVELVRALSREMDVAPDRIITALTIPSNSNFLKHIGNVASVYPEALAAAPLADAAVMAQGTDFTKGGIDLNPRLLDLQIKRDDTGIPLPVNQQPIENMHIDGFLPVIINVSPVTNLPLLLGLAETEGEGQISYGFPGTGMEPAPYIEGERLSLAK